jgi:hypothetical protein
LAIRFAFFSQAEYRLEKPLLRVNTGRSLLWPKQMKPSSDPCHCLHVETVIIRGIQEKIALGTNKARRIEPSCGETTASHCIAEAEILGVTLIRRGALFCSRQIPLSPFRGTVEAESNELIGILKLFWTLARETGANVATSFIRSKWWHSAPTAIFFYGKGHTRKSVSF